MFLIYALILICAWTYYFYKKSFTYWHVKGIPYIKPSIPFGNLEYPWKSIPPIVQYAKYYKIFKDRGEKHGGTYLLTRPAYIPVDPEYVRNILIRDYHYFDSRGIYYNERVQPISSNLFTLDGDKWKSLRQKLSPTFSTGKMKMMFETMMKCTEPLHDRMKRVTANREAIDVKDTLCRFTTDVIGSCAFGIECNSFESLNTEFAKYGNMISDKSISTFIKTMFAFNFQDFSRKIGIVLMKQEASDFFTNLAMDTYNQRVRNNIYRDDFMQFLIELTEKKVNLQENIKVLSMDELVAQIFIFFAAGFDTSSSMLTFCLFELAVNTDLQDRLRKEIRSVLEKYNGEITYESLADMKYMEQVMNETMRKYPLGGFLPRTCTENYKIPGTNTVIDKGTQVFISVLGLHRDPEFYPDPDKFDPERFSNENKGKIVPGTFLPFGDGPRICIGLRFGLMQAKTCLIRLLKDFEFSLNSRTKVPLELTFGFVTNLKESVWLNSRRVK
uniref:Cytochrome P450 6a13-like protein n=1 Tax=Holotrichia oblita TaxID=644536 RepID=A0A977TNF4_HOLOL|nr:cytochrome P450 6a13-like protein [Holotrichia oblita]